MEFKRRSNHSDLHTGNWDDEFHRVTRETNERLARGGRVSPPPRYGRRKLPSAMQPHHNGGVI